MILIMPENKLTEIVKEVSVDSSRSRTDVNHGVTIILFEGHHLVRSTVIPKGVKEQLE